MRKDLTDITVIMDRSGSMSSIKAEAEGGLNSFIEKQKALPGEANFTLVQFDTEYEVVHRGIPIKEVPKCFLEPRGWTALLDAVGKTINDVGFRLSALPESYRPGLVTIVILTDGQENYSKEFKQDQVRKMVEHQSSVYKWQFIYLGANQDAFLVAKNLGIDLGDAANYSPTKVQAAYENTSGKLARMRYAAASGQSVNAVKAFTPEELKEMR